MNAIKGISTGFVGAALGSLTSIAAGGHISYQPAYPVHNQTIALRVDDFTPDSYSLVGLHTVSVSGPTIRIEGCLSNRGVGRPIGVPYDVRLNLSLPAGDYAVEYHRNASAQAICQIDRGTSELRGSGTLKVRSAGPTWPPPPGEVAAVHHYYHVRGGYFMTSIEAERAALESGRLVGWERVGPPQDWTSSEGFGFFSVPAPDRVPVCRLYSERFAPYVQHFYTADSGECEFLKQRPVWIYEGIVAYVWPVRRDGTCDQGLPLYRFMNIFEPRHYYTENELRRDAFLGNWLTWTAEGYGKGVVMCVPPKP